MSIEVFGGKRYMEFLANVIETVIQAVFIIAVAYGGIICGKNLRARKNAKATQDEANVDNAQ